MPSGGLILLPAGTTMGLGTGVPPVVSNVTVKVSPDCEGDDDDGSLQVVKPKKSTKSSAIGIQTRIMSLGYLNMVLPPYGKTELV